tara:strand:+ start:175 stop:789 length:615 start_codon:yes stop_codon:yes gene_type:complete
MKLFAFVLTLVVAALPARAISVIDFTTHPCGGLVVCTVPLSGGVYDGVIATIDSPVVEAPASSTGTVLYNLSNGLALGSGVFGTSWNISFDTDVFWVGGTISAALLFDLGVDITGPGGAIATGLFASTAPGPFDLSDPIAFAAGETYTFSTLHRFIATSALPRNIGAIAFTFLSFDVPEASTLALLLPGLAGLGWLARRRRPYR